MSRLISILSLFSAIMIGCSGPGMEEDASTGQQGRFGLVSISYDHDWANTEKTGLLSTTAQFIQYTAIDRQYVTKLLGLPVDPRKDLPSEETCKIYDLSLALQSETDSDTENSRNLELLEVGELHVQTEAHTVTLSPRHFPWLLPFISGVFYGESQASWVRKVGNVKAISNGGETIGAFSAHLASPPLPRLTHIGDNDNNQQSSLETITDRTQDLLLRWSVSKKQKGDILYIELRFTKGGKDLALRCQPRDDGEFVLPHTLLEGIGANSRVTLELARLRRAFFSTTGLEKGELRVTIRDTATLQFR